MLEIKFQRIKNVVLMDILRQDDIERGCGKFYEAENSISLYSSESPEISGICIFLRGRNTEKDKNVAVYQFKNSEVATDKMRQYVEAVEEYNAYCKANQENEDETVVDEEIAIVGRDDSDE